MVFNERFCEKQQLRIGKKNNIEICKLLQTGQKGVEKYAWFIVPTVYSLYLTPQSRRPTAAGVDDTTYIWQAKIELEEEVRPGQDNDVDLGQYNDWESKARDLLYTM